MMNLRKNFNIRLISSTLAATAALLLNFSAIADELIMKDGSRLLGEVIKEDSGTVDFKTPYADVIKVKWQEISEVITDKPVTILLKDNNTFTTKHVKNTEDGIVITEESGVTKSLASDDIAYVNPEPWRLGKGWKWSGLINLDLLHERGNTDKDEYNGDWTTTIRSRGERYKFWGDYLREKDQNILTDENWNINGRYDYFISKKLFYAAILSVEHDRPADLQRRTITGPLIGYEFYESTAMNLNVAGGPQYVKEEFYATKNDDYLALGWHVDFDRFLISDHLQFYHRHRGLIESSDTSNLVWDAWTGFRFPVYAGITVSTEIQIEYDGGAQQDVKKTDTTYSLKLGYQW